MRAGLVRGKIERLMVKQPPRTTDVGLMAAHEPRGRPEASKEEGSGATGAQGTYESAKTRQSRAAWVVLVSAKVGKERKGAGKGSEFHG
jgi:hypothetical protein